MSVSAQYTQKFNQHFSASLLGEYGAEMYRFNGTLGAKFFDNDFFKVSAEQFSQNLPFDFAAGDIHHDVLQNAYGARYQKNFAIPVWRHINAGIYYANAPNVSLDPILFNFNDATAVNYRHIAGSISKGVDLGSAFHITKTTEFAAQIYYDYLRYDTGFTDHSEDDAQGWGGELGIKQLLGPRFALEAAGSVRKIYNTYTAGIFWMPPLFPSSQLMLLAQTIVSHNDTPDNHILGLEFAYHFSAGMSSAFALSHLITNQDVGLWTHTPAVYMEQVLVVGEEHIEVVDNTKNHNSISSSCIAPTITSMTQTSGPTSGSTNLTIYGTDFIQSGCGLPNVFFGTAPAETRTTTNTSIKTRSQSLLRPSVVQRLLWQGVNYYWQTNQMIMRRLHQIKDRPQANKKLLLQIHGEILFLEKL